MHFKLDNVRYHMEIRFGNNVKMLCMRNGCIMLLDIMLQDNIEIILVSKWYTAKHTDTVLLVYLIAEMKTHNLIHENDWIKDYPTTMSILITFIVVEMMCSTSGELNYFTFAGSWFVVKTFIKSIWYNKHEWSFMKVLMWRLHQFYRATVVLFF